MDQIAIPERIKTMLKKYKYVLLVLGVGIFLMMLPKSEEMTDPAPVDTREEEQSQAEALQEILAQIDGVGKVKVLLTESTSEETVYQTDLDQSDSAESSTAQEKTVILSGADREERGLVRQVHSPKYLGAIIVCQGGENASVRLAIVEAVSDVTGISADRISVLKMK